PPNGQGFAGGLSGGGIPLDDTRVARVAFAGPPSGNVLVAAPLPSADSYEGFVGWYGSSTTSGTIHALVLQTTNGAVTGFPGYGMRAGVTVTDGAMELQGQDIVLGSALASQSLTGTLVAPTAF